MNRLYANDGKELKEGDIALFRLHHGTHPCRITKIYPLGTVDVIDSEGDEFRISGLAFSRRMVAGAKS